MNKTKITETVFFVILVELSYDLYDEFLCLIMTQKKILFLANLFLFHLFLVKKKVKMSKKGLIELRNFKRLLNRTVLDVFDYFFDFFSVKVRFG